MWLGAHVVGVGIDSEEEASNALISSSDSFGSVNFWFLCVKPFSQTPFVSLKYIYKAFCAQNYRVGG